MLNSGQTLVIEAEGTVHKAILEGAYVNLQVKYGYIRLINTKADLCEQIKNVDLECPIEKGKLVITKSIELPKEIPPVSVVMPLLTDYQENATNADSNSRASTS
jgi:hypothetical protein